MAKKKSGKIGGKRRSKRKTNKKHPRRRRNPSGTFGSRLVNLALAGAAGVATGVVVYWGGGQLPAHPNVAMYGLPAAGLVLGAVVAKSHPLIGAGIGVGAVAPFAVPIATKVLNPSHSTTAALGRAARTMRAIPMGAVDRRMGAVDVRTYG